MCFFFAWFILNFIFIFVICFFFFFPFLLVEHKWLDRDGLQEQTDKVRDIISELFTDEGFRRRGVKTPPLPSGSGAAPTPLPKPSRPASLQLTRSAWKPEISSPTTSTTSKSTIDPSSPIAVTYIYIYMFLYNEHTK